MPQEYQPAVHLQNKYLLRCGSIECAIGIIGFFLFEGFPLSHLWITLVSSGITSCGVYRLFQYFKRNQEVKSLIVNRTYNLSFRKIEGLKGAAERLDDLYLGEGFLWETKHCQAYHEMRFLRYKEKAFQLLSKSKEYSHIHNTGHATECTQIHRCPEHTAIISSISSEKTKLLELLLTQRIMQGQTVIIIDPKENKELLDKVYQLCLLTHRKEDFSYFSLAHPQHSTAINPFANWTNAHEAVAHLMSIMPQVGSCKSGMDCCSDVLEVLIQVMQLADCNVNLSSLYKYGILDRQALYHRVQTLLERKNMESRHKAQLIVALKELQLKMCLFPNYYQVMTTMLQPALQKLVADSRGALLSPQKNALSWRNIIENKKVVYFGLNATKDAFLASHVGRLIMQDLIAYVSTKYTPQASNEYTHLFVDDFYSVAYESYPEALKKSRTTALKITMGMQMTADMEGKLPDSVRREIYKNITNKFFLRVSDTERAKELLSTLGRCEMHPLSRLCSASEKPTEENLTNLYNSGYREHNDVGEADLIPAEILSLLPSNEAFLITEENHPFKLRLPILDTSELPNVSFTQDILQTYYPQKHNKSGVLEKRRKTYSMQNHASKCIETK